MTVGTKQKLAFQNEELSLNINFKQVQHSVCEQLPCIKIDSNHKLEKKNKLIKSVLKYHQKSIFFQQLRNI
jgi:hypothetical protein